MHNRSFRLLWTSQAIANFADILYTLAVVLVLYRYTDSAFAASLVPLCRVAAKFAGSFVAPLMMDRWALPLLLRRSQNIQTVLFAGLGLFLAGGLHAWTWPAIYAWISMLSFFDGWTTPAKHALLPRLVPREDWARANGWVSTVDQTVGLAGWALGGVTVAVIGEDWTLGLTAALFALVSAMTRMIREPRGLADVKPTMPGTRLQSMREGWATIRKTPLVRALLGIEVIEGVVGSIWIGSFLLVFVEEILGVGERWWGIINACYFLGAILGGVLASALLPKLMNRLQSVMLLGALGMSALTLLFAYTELAWLAAFLTVLMGPAYQFRDIAQQTLLQHAVPEERYPKLQAAFQSVVLSVFGGSVLLMGAITDVFGIRVTYVIGAVFFLLSALYSFYIKLRISPKTE